MSNQPQDIELKLLDLILVKAIILNDTMLGFQCKNKKLVFLVITVLIVYALKINTLLLFLIFT